MSDEARLIIITPSSIHLAVGLLTIDRVSKFDRYEESSAEWLAHTAFIDQAIRELLADANQVNGNLLKLRDIIGGQNLGNDDLACIRSIRQALGAPGPDGTFSEELGLIVSVLGGI